MSDDLFRMQTRPEPPSGEPDPQLIAMLEHILSKARSGKVVSVAIAAFHVDHCTSTSFHLGEGHIAPLVGATTYLQRRLLDTFEAPD